MKSKLSALAAVFVISIGQSSGQGTFVFDQQSSTDETPFPGTGGVLQQFTPVGQSFTPTLSSIDFIRLKLYDHIPNNGLGATLYINLRTDSISGPVLGQAAGMPLPDSFADAVNFFFPTSVPLTPGMLYFFEPVVQSGDEWLIDVGPYNYPGGTTISQGHPLSGSDLWFREGLLVPEPSTFLLLLLGGSFLAFRRRKRSV